MKIERARAIQLFLDESAVGERTRGKPYLQNEEQTRMFCPKCLEEIADDPGYGLAFGGMGVYWFCEQDGCDWFYKIMDADERLCEDEGCPQAGSPHVCVEKERLR